MSPSACEELQGRGDVQSTQRKFSPAIRFDITSRHLDCLGDADFPPINIVSRKSGQPARDSDTCW